MRKTCLTMVHELARENEKVVYIGSDPGPGTLDSMKDEFPDRFFIEGISEAHVVGMAAGLAMEGYVPYVNTIATFLTRRCLEQVAIDVCLHDLPVRLIANGGGFVYAPLGPTHTAIEDIALMRALPNMSVVCPSDADEMRRFMAVSADWPQPIYIRLAKGGDPIVSSDADGFTIGKAIVKRNPGEVVIVATGIMVDTALRVADLLKPSGITVGVVNMHTVKPLDVDTLLSCAKGPSLMVTLEEHARAGGLGSAVMEALQDEGMIGAVALERLGIPDVFTHNYGSQKDLLRLYGLSAEAVANRIRASLSAN